MNPGAVRPMISDVWHRPSSGHVPTVVLVVRTQASMYPAEAAGVCVVPSDHPRQGEPVGRRGIVYEWTLGPVDLQRLLGPWRAFHGRRRVLDEVGDGRRIRLLARRGPPARDPAARRRTRGSPATARPSSIDGCRDRRPRPATTRPTTSATTSRPIAAIAIDLERRGRRPPLAATGEPDWKRARRRRHPWGQSAVHRSIVSSNADRGVRRWPTDGAPRQHARSPPDDEPLSLPGTARCWHWGTVQGGRVELSGYLAVARRWWWTLLVATWVAAISGYVVASQIPATYEAETQLLVGPYNTDVDTLRAAGAMVQTYAGLVTTTPLLGLGHQGGRLDADAAGPAARDTGSPPTTRLGC